jgi:hypothetical protein
MNLILLSAILLLANIHADADNGFYSNERTRYYYSYHPYKSHWPRSRNALTTSMLKAERRALEDDLSRLFSAQQLSFLSEQISFSFRTDPNMPDKSVNCSYSYETLLLNCNSSTGDLLSSCVSDVDFAYLDKISFDILSLGISNNKSTHSLVSTMQRYRIFPFKMLSNNDSTGYDDGLIVYDYVVPIYGYELVSYMNSSSKQNTYRKEEPCFNNLIGLLNESKMLSQMQIIVHETLTSMLNMFD